MQRISLFCLCSLAVSSVGCVTSGAFDKAGFIGRDSAYRVAYVEPGKRLLLPADWLLENFEKDAEGGPAQMKTEGIYATKVDWTCADGSTSVAEFITHDLKFSHKSSDASLWVRALPIPLNMRERALKVLAENWVKGLNGTVYDFTFGASVDAKRIATKMVESKETTVSGQPAHEVLFDLVNLDQLELDPNAPRTRVRALFISAPLKKALRAPDSLRAVEPGAEATPALLFVGYAASEKEFEAQLGAFEGFVQRISIQKKP
jgi:hypothetical protein